MTDTKIIPPPKRNVSRPYADIPGPISADDAHAEPAERRAFQEESLPNLSKPAPTQSRPAPQFTIHALLDDFPFEVSFSGNADQLAATIARLRAIGAVPPTQAARAAVEEERARSAPTCQCDACDRYSKAMKESTKQPGTYYCPGKIGTKAGQPVYCKERA